MDSRIPIKWKCLYEIIAENRARNLYLDIEESRPLGISRTEHDMECWLKVQLIMSMLRHGFGTPSVLDVCYSGPWME
jgi:hypothetical protein